jgi:dUTPase
MASFSSSISSKIMVLKLFVSDSDPLLKEQYKVAIEKHNLKLQTDPFMDAGFDLLSPSTGQNCMSSLQGPNKIDFLVKCSATYLKKSKKESESESKEGNHEHNVKKVYTGYYMYPRSSLSKTKLRLANSVGIIDSGYRGNLIGMFDCISAGRSALCECEYDYVVKPYERLLQICSPNLCPIYVEMVDTVEELSELTLRGDGGFGSTTPL